MMNEFQLPGHSAMDKSQTLNYYFRLESESSMQSEDTESVTSLQGKETEFAQDSEDTDSDDYFEYEVASLSGDEAATGGSSSYGTDDDIFVAEEVIAAVLGDTSVEAWAADGGEDSTTTESEDFDKTDFRTCAQCKSKNNNPRFLFCEKCYQVRKSFYPPPPKRSKKRNIESNKGTVDVDNLRSCLSGLSQDSGVGCSSQEFLSLDFKEIKVPEQHLEKGSTSSSSGVSSEGSNGSSNSIKTSDTGGAQTTSRKRKSSESFSDNEVRRKSIRIEGPLSINSENTETLKSQLTEKSDSKELCIACTVGKIDGIFAHGSSAHASCCYKCAIKIWKATKRCPVCNRRVSYVFRLYTN